MKVPLHALTGRVTSRVPGMDQGPEVQEGPTAPGAGRAFGWAECGQSLGQPQSFRDLERGLRVLVNRVLGMLFVPQLHDLSGALANVVTVIDLAAEGARDVERAR